MLNQLFSGFVHWRAVLQGTSTSAALGFLYLIRCSVHGTALKKNIPNLSRTVRTEDKEIIGSPKISSLARTVPVRSRKFSEGKLNPHWGEVQRISILTQNHCPVPQAVDIEAVMLNSSSKTQTETEAQEFTVICAKPTNIGLKGILVPYYMSQLLAALVGGFGEYWMMIRLSGAFCLFVTYFSHPHVCAFVYY